MFNIGQKQARNTHNKIQVSIDQLNDYDHVHHIGRHDHIEDDDEIILATNKNSRDEIIEYDPKELSYDGSNDDNHYYHEDDMDHDQEMYDEEHQYSKDKDLKVVGKSMPMYCCKNWGKNPYYVVVSRSHRNIKNKIHNFDSLDNQFNCLGIDDKEALKIVSAQPLNNNKVNWEMINSIDEWQGHNKDNSLVDIYENWIPGQAVEHQSEEIIAVNDSDNEMIVPQEMEIHDIEATQRQPNMIMADSIDYLSKNKLSMSKSQLMSSS